MTARWVLSTAGESYSFTINPNEQTSPVPVRGYTWMQGEGGFTGLRAGRAPHTYSFSGVLRSQEQYDKLHEWLRKRIRVNVLTDLGQSFDIRLVSFEGRRGRHRPAATWRMLYTMECLLLSLTTVAPAFPPDPAPPPSNPENPPSETLASPEEGSAAYDSGANVVYVNWS